MFFPNELTSLLESLGLNPTKPIEAIEYYKNSDGTHLYEVLFNVIGHIRKSPDPAEQITGKLVMKSLTDKIQIGLKTDVDFPKHYPKNTFQFEFLINSPWVLSDFDE